MTKSEMWEACCAKYPEWRDDEHIVKLKARGLKRLLMQAMDEARPKIDPPTSDFLSAMFGNTKRK